eukprot:TRINITY_DN17561_c0_g1_i2.p1 TRINITY_DN17561_c0_g1~~TRINITY_DN17561_c0_g1_i2.p1  ORF type:complete len:120 (+),score=31.19 TRINITY_DN17561_c0_g1_i2:29-361(+)
MTTLTHRPTRTTTTIGNDANNDTTEEEEGGSNSLYVLEESYDNPYTCPLPETYGYISARRVHIFRTTGEDEGNATATVNTTTNNSATAGSDNASTKSNRDAADSDDQDST